MSSITKFAEMGGTGEPIGVPNIICLRGKDIFNLWDKYFKENDLECGKLVGCTTDGAPSMLGQK